MAGADLGDEDDVERITWAVPNPSRARDLVLSRLERLAHITISTARELTHWNAVPTR